MGGLRILGTINQAPEFVRSLRVDEVVVACEVSPEWLKVVLEVLAPTGVKVSLFSFSETVVAAPAAGAGDVGSNEVKPQRKGTQQ